MPSRRSRNSCGSCPPVQFTKPRFVRRDVELGGVHLKKGDKVMPMLAAANFDPQANDHPEKLDLERRPNRHLAFGAGIHFCLGHQLARMEGKCALQALFERWPKLTLATEFRASLAHPNRHPGPRAVAGYGRPVRSRPLDKYRPARR